MAFIQYTSVLYTTLFLYSTLLPFGEEIIFSIHFPPSIAHLACNERFLEDTGKAISGKHCFCHGGQKLNWRRHKLLPHSSSLPLFQTTSPGFGKLMFQELLGPKKTKSSSVFPLSSVFLLSHREECHLPSVCSLSGTVPGSTVQG